MQPNVPNQGAPQSSFQNASGQQQIDPNFKKQVEVYSAGLLQLLHGKETKQQVYSMLKSGNPVETIPRVALVINQQMEGSISKKGGLPPLKLRFAAGLILVNELMEIVVAGGFGEKQEFTPEESQKVLQDSMQMYIEQGLKQRTIDPIELQEAVEPMLSPEQRRMGMQLAQQRGLQRKPGQQAAMIKYADQKVQSALQKQKPTQQGGGMFNQVQGGMR